jgi:hypothetical protein
VLKNSEIKIENQIWMAENLYVDTFRNGDLFLKLISLKNGYLQVDNNNRLVAIIVCKEVQEEDSIIGMP